MHYQYYIVYEDSPEEARAPVPFEADDTLKQRRELNALRQEMQTAIDTENFERAAELRDEIYRRECA